MERVLRTQASKSSSLLIAWLPSLARGPSDRYLAFCISDPPTSSATCEDAVKYFPLVKARYNVKYGVPVAGYEYSSVQNRVQGYKKTSQGLRLYEVSCANNTIVVFQGVRIPMRSSPYSKRWEICGIATWPDFHSPETQCIKMQETMQPTQQRSRRCLK